MNATLFVGRSAWVRGLSNGYMQSNVAQITNRSVSEYRNQYTRSGFGDFFVVTSLSYF